MSYTQAKTNLSRPIREAQKGKEGVIRCGEQPLAKIVPIASAARNRIPGALKGEIWSAPDAFDLRTDEELRELGFQ